MTQDFHDSRYLLRWWKIKSKTKYEIQSYAFFIFRQVFDIFEFTLKNRYLTQYRQNTLVFSTPEIYHLDRTAPKRPVLSLKCQYAIAKYKPSLNKIVTNNTIA